MVVSRNLQRKYLACLRCGKIVYTDKGHRFCRRCAKLNMEIEVGREPVRMAEGIDTEGGGLVEY